MGDSRAETIVLGFPEYREQSRSFAAAAEVNYADVDLHRFPDGESLVRLPERVPGHVVVCQTLIDANRRLIDVLLALSTARSLGATQLTLVAPYLCYMRQDKAFRPGQAISQQIIGKLLAHEIDALVTVDPHLHRVSRLDEAVPVPRALATSAAPLMAEWLRDRGGEPMIVGPDEESVQWVQRIASTGAYDYCVARKQRLGDNDIRISLPHRDFSGREIVLVDDVASTGHTLAEAARQLFASGAGSISVLVTHAMFADGALQRLKSAGIDEIISTDSIPHPSNRLNLDQLLATGLKRAWSPAEETAG
jgi:ribose-phosphate pyrophosphokinase